MCCRNEPLTGLAGLGTATSSRFPSPSWATLEAALTSFCRHLHTVVAAASWRCGPGYFRSTTSRGYWNGSSAGGERPLDDTTRCRCRFYPRFSAGHRQYPPPPLSARDDPPLCCRGSRLSAPSDLIWLLFPTSAAPTVSLLSPRCRKPRPDLSLTPMKSALLRFITARRMPSRHCHGYCHGGRSHHASQRRFAAYWLHT